MRTPGVPGTRATGGAWSVALCSLALAAGSYATLGFAPLAPLIREDFSLARWQIGAITAIVFGGAAITLGAVGPPDRPLRRAADAGGVPSLPSPAAACSPRSPRARRSSSSASAAVGLSYGLITPPTNVIVRGAPTTRHRSLLMSIKQVGVTIGGFISGVTMPTIAHHVGWRLALLAPGGGLRGRGALGAARAAARSRGTPAKRGASRRDRARSTASCRVASRSASGGFGFVMGGLQIAFVTYLSLYLKEEHGYRLAAAGISLAVTMAAGTVGRLLWARHLRSLLRHAARLGPAPQRAAQHGGHDGARAAAVRGR